MAAERPLAACGLVSLGPPARARAGKVKQFRQGPSPLAKRLAFARLNPITIYVTSASISLGKGLPPLEIPAGTASFARYARLSSCAQPSITKNRTAAQPKSSQGDRKTRTEFALLAAVGTTISGAV